MVTDLRYALGQLQMRRDEARDGSDRSLSRAALLDRMRRAADAIERCLEAATADEREASEDDIRAALDFGRTIDQHLVPWTVDEILAREG